MNIIDIIILIVLAYAAYSGFSNGVVAQVCSIIGLLAAIWAGSIYAERVTNFLNLGNDIWGFIIIVIVAIILFGAISKLIRKILGFAGLGGVDRLLGLALALFKYLLIMSFIFSAIEVLNKDFNLFDGKVFSSSPMFNFIVSLSEFISPAWEWFQQQLSEIEVPEELKNTGRNGGTI